MDLPSSVISSFISNISLLIPFANLHSWVWLFCLLCIRFLIHFISSSSFSFFTMSLTSYCFSLYLVQHYCTLFWEPSSLSARFHSFSASFLALLALLYPLLFFHLFFTLHPIVSSAISFIISVISWTDIFSVTLSSSISLYLAQFVLSLMFHFPLYLCFSP